MNQSVYSALVNGETVCAGYARAMQYLMQRLGIPCYYCTGYAGQNHAWNIVRLDDGYYNVDVTWDDTPGGEYDYFNRTDAEYAGTHVRQSLSVNLPVCEAQTYYPR
jgi:transglutaminase/protease-like cytokinesis protein 3